jgi:hypothetical protein
MRSHVRTRERAKSCPPAAVLFSEPMSLHGGYILGAQHGGLLGEGQALPLAVLLTLLFWTTCLMLHAGATLYNLQLYSKIFAYLFCSKDTKWPANPDTGSIPESGQEERTVIFVRHGESTWNETFNPVGVRKLLFPFGVISALITESYLLLNGKRDSWFYDSSLNAVGQTQASDLRKFLAKDKYPGMTSQGTEDIKLLQGVSTTPSVVVSSTLRRAVSTVAIALYDRLRRTGEKIVWLPACQEISRNPDTLCITPVCLYVSLSFAPAPPHLHHVGHFARFPALAGRHRGQGRHVRSGRARSHRGRPRWRVQDDDGVIR